MGRPERPLAAPAGPVRDLAAALREARRTAGNPSYRQMAAVTHYSAGMLARAASGHALPSQEITLAYAAACNGDPDEWRHRWQQARNALTASCSTGRSQKADDGQLNPNRPGFPQQPQPGGLGWQAPPRPAQLPTDTAGFTGRAGYLRELDKLLTRQDSSRPAPAAAWAIHGPAGVGKTALAVHWAQQVADEFPDGQLYVDLRGYSVDPPVDTSAVLGRFLRALGTRPGQVPVDTEEAAGLFRSLAWPCRMLIVLDNAADSDQLRALLPGAPRCVTLITSRDRLGGLAATHGVRRLALEPLSLDEAMALIASLTDRRQAGTDPGVITELAELCGRLPLALRIAAANLADRAPCGIGQYVAELRGRDRLAALQVPGDEHAAVRTAFSLSYAQLGTSARRLFRLLGLIPGPDLTTGAAASLAGSTAQQAARDLNALTAANLLQEHLPSRFVLHDLLRLYATDLAAREEDEPGRDQALRRLHNWYLHAIAAADSVFCPGRRPLPLSAAGPACVMPVFASHEQAVAWCDDEEANLTAVTRQAAESGHDDLAWKIAYLMSSYYDLRMPLADMLATTTICVDAARRAGDQDGLSRGLNVLAGAYFHLGRFEDCRQRLEESLAINRQTGVRRGMAVALDNMGSVYRRLGRHDQGVTYHQQAIVIAREAGNERVMGIALGNLGEAYREMGRPADALACHRQALDVVREAAEQRSVAIVLDNLGEDHRMLGNLSEALDCYRQAMAIRRHTRDRHGEAVTLNGMGNVLADSGQHDAAWNCWRQAADIFEELRDPQAAEIRSRPRHPASTD